MKLMIGLMMFFSMSAFADFEADMEISSIKEGKLEKVMTARIQGKGDMHRFKITKPMPMTMIMDKKTQSGHMLMDEAKMAMKTDMKKAGLNQPKCSGENVTECYQKEGFVLSGNETIEGVECEVWTKKNEKEKYAFVKVWLPKVATGNKNEMMALKMENYDKEGGTLQGMMQVKNLNSTAKLDDSLFKIPAGYQVMDMGGGMPMGPGGGKAPGAGFNPEMMKQMFKKSGN